MRRTLLATGLSELFAVGCAIVTTLHDDAMAGYENIAPKPAPARVNTAHHPKTMPNEVPRFSLLLTQVKPIAVKTSVQIMKMSNAVPSE